MRPARTGDVAALRAALESDLRAGRLTRGAVAEIAQVLALHELQAAKGADAIQRVQQVRSCAGHLQDGLVERANGTDGAAPEAALILQQSRLVEPDKWRAHASDADPLWRAVGVRTLIESQDADGRRAAMLDPDENVRLSAVRAAEDARAPADVQQLLDVARLDPNALVRVTAVRAIGQFGSPETVLRLKDLLTNASDPVRQAIVVAWSWPGMLEAGGQRELVLIAETAKDESSVLAGGILLRLGPETRGVGISTLLKHIDGGAARVRSLAISLAPLDDPSVRQAVKKLSTAPDPEVKLAALTSLARDPAERAKALEAIGSMAASTLPIAARARAAMARLGDARVTALLLKDGESKVAEQRVDAVRGLIELGDIARAAMFLADADAGVRTRAACSILVASERW